MFTNIHTHIQKFWQWCIKHPTHLVVIVTGAACAVTLSIEQQSMQSLLWPRTQEVIIAPVQSSKSSSSATRRRVPYRVTRKPVRSPALSSARKTSLKFSLAPAKPRGEAGSSAMSRMPWKGSGSASSAPAYHMSTGSFPAFVKAVYPVSQVPNWGAMHKAAEWNRSYAELTRDDLVPVPAYDMEKLMTPMKTLVQQKDEEEVTRKLFYSTKYFGKYDLDAGEFTAIHPGVDLKLALGTPLGSVAGGRVNSVRNTFSLGQHVVIEHRLPEGVFYSVYGHLGSVTVQEGQDVIPGQMIGTVGMTGNTSGPHLHLQIDRGMPGEDEHIPYLPKKEPTPAEAENYVVHPIRFIEKY